MARNVITHMYRNSGSYRTIDGITGWLRIHGFYKIKDMIAIERDSDNVEVGRIESVEGFGPLIGILAKLSNFKNSDNQCTVRVRNDTGRFV